MTRVWSILSMKSTDPKRLVSYLLLWRASLWAISKPTASLVDWMT
jgi:hypothetical protein